MSERILIIDDEDHIRRMVRLTLETAGCEAAEAGTGMAGLELFGDGSTWDAVLLDQKMPGLDSLETLRRIKQQRALNVYLTLQARNALTKLDRQYLEAVRTALAPV